MTKTVIRISDEETVVLQGLAANVPDGGVIVEIGAAWGYSCSKMAAACRDTVRVITIDPWSLHPGKHQAKREQRFHETIAPYKDKITPMKAFSQDVSLAVTINLLFIDGNHQYKFVSTDYERFSPLVPKGGVLVFHDYHVERAPGVTQAIDELVIPSGLWNWEVKHTMWVGRRL